MGYIFVRFVGTHSENLINILQFFIAVRKRSIFTMLIADNNNTFTIIGKSLWDIFLLNFGRKKKKRRKNEIKQNLTI